MATEESVTIKGTKDGLLITLQEGDWQHILADLKNHLDRAAAFFSGGQVLLQLGNRALQQPEMESLLALLEPLDIELTTILSDSAVTRRTAKRLGYLTARPEPPSARRPAETANGLLVRRTLRSGQTVRHAGSVIVIGDVNPGAEVVAGGDVIVWGNLRGVVHAGALGDEDAFVCALSLVPTQLRIGSQIARPPEDATRRPHPEMAHVEDGRIIVRSWERR
jgi:septum site-determining protein MinC